MTAREEQLGRQWKLLAQLAARSGGRAGVSARQLAERLRVSPEVVKRDLKALTTAGLKISQVRQAKELLYRWEGPPELRPVEPDEDEWVSLFLAATELRTRGFPRQGKALASIAARASQSTPRAKPNPDRPQEAASPEGLPAAGLLVREEVIQPLLRAMADRRALRISYRPIREETPCTRELYPDLVFHDGQATLLAARGPDLEEPRLFPVQRIQRVEDAGHGFPPLHGFRIDEFLHGAYRVVKVDAIQRVRIRFKPDLEPELRDFQWPVETGVERMASGYLRVTAMMTLLPELESWLRSFGERVQVLEPTWLQLSHQNRQVSSAKLQHSPACFDRSLE